MRQSASPWAIASFAIPPSPPPAVAEAYEAFQDVARQWGSTKNELTDARAARPDARTADVRTIADAAREGKSVDDPRANERALEEKIAELEARLRGLDTAVDEAGNDLAAIIAENRAKWLKLLAVAESAAAKRYADAIAKARAALDELRPARGAVAWLEGFDHGRATAGKVKLPERRGAAVPTDRTRPRHDDPD